MVTTNYKWRLRKGGKKERCPQCGRQRFVPFVLTADPSVKAGPEYGRCDREQSCGYFRYPDKPVDTGAVIARQPEMPKEPILIPSNEVMEAYPDYQYNSLLLAYIPLFGEHWPLVSGRMIAYHCGTGTHGECIYYQYDGRHVRTAKAILYGKDGHRVKVEDGGLPVWWLHKSPTLAKYTAGKELRQCFFGQHLLNRYPESKVYVVEAEKTALLMAATDDRTDRIWLACGGSQMLKGAIDLSCLEGRDVTLVPDDGQYWNWRRTADAHGWKCVDIAMWADGLEYYPGCDIWDLKEQTLKLKAR